MRTTVAARVRGATTIVPDSSADEQTCDRAQGRASTPRRCVVEHQGMRFVHQPDGTIVCEPVATFSSQNLGSDNNVAPPALGLSRHNILTGIKRAVGVVALFGGFAGGSLALLQVSDAARNDEIVDYTRLVGNVHQAVRGLVLGVLTGGLVAPVAAVAGVVRLAVRPVLLGLSVHGVSRWVARNHIGAAAILKKLQSGDLSRQLDALRQLVARLASSAPFCSQFKRLAGVEVLLKLLSDLLAEAERAANAISGPQASLTLRSLAELSQQGDAANTMVETGGVSILLQALACSLGSQASDPKAPAEDTRLGDAAVLLYATTTLARIASKNAVAQQMLASEPTAAPVLVSLLEQATARRVRGATLEACDDLRAQTIALAQAVALEPAGKASLGQAGGVEALAAAVMLSSPWSLGQANAAAALHALVRGDIENQRRLAAIAPAGLSACINRALASGPSMNASNTMSAAAPSAAVDESLKPLSGTASRPLTPQDCHAHRADLLALSNVISRFATPSSGGAVVPSAAAPARSLHLLQRLRLRPVAKPTSTDKAPTAAAAAEAVVPGPSAAAATTKSGALEDDGLESEDWDCTVDVSEGRNLTKSGTPSL